MMKFNAYAPTKLVFGSGKLNSLHKQKMPGKKAMIVISNGKSTRVNGYLDRTEEQLRLAGVETVVFDKVGPNPLKSVVEEGACEVRARECDFIVALGGGSVMDAAKVIAMFAPQPGELWDYVAGATGKNMPLVNPALPVIAITTTAGTGSEVDQWGVITNPETNEKIGVGGTDQMFPALAIVDPELMKSVPPTLTAYQGFDALFHSVEGFISSFNNLIGEMVQLPAIEKIAKYLPGAVKNGSDMEARENLAFANTMSGYSMVVSTCTSEHAMEHAMSAYHPTLPHGAGLIMISKEYYTHFAQSHACDEKFVTLAKAMGVKDAKEPMDFVRALCKLQQDCGVADLKMSDYDIAPDEFAVLAENAKATMGGLFKCDRVALKQGECISIYEKSYK